MNKLTEKGMVLICENGVDRIIESYFPHELAHMLRKHDVIAVYLPPYLRRQAF